MKIFNLKAGLFSTIAPCLIFYLPLLAFGGTIKTNITSSYEVQRSGSISIKVDISNKGTDTAFNTALTLFLGKEAKRHAGLGNNPPNRKIHVEIQPIHPLPGPGKYAGVLMVEFEEQSGNHHRAYHVFEITYRMDETPSYRPALNFRLETPAVNRKAFWRKKSEIQISMKNGYQEAIRPYISVYLPDGFTTSQPDRQCELSPGEEKWVKVPLTIDPMAKNINPYHMVVQYNLNGIHYSRHVKGTIRLEEKPVLFKWFAVAGVTVLAILATIIYFRNRKA
jgi:hypothetical protein